MIFAYKIYSFIINDKRWEFRGNYASEQSSAGISEGSNVGPALPLRVANEFSDSATDIDIRYCVDYLGRIWYSRFNKNSEPTPLESPCYRACFSAIENCSVSKEEIEVIKKACEDGSQEVSNLIKNKG